MAEKDEMEVSEVKPAVQPKPVPVPQINWKVTGIQGGLNRGAVEKVLKASQTQFEQVVASQTGVNGELELELEVDAQGQVLQVKTLQDKLNQSDLISQIVQVLKGLTFGATQDGKPAKVKVKFEFKG